MKITKIVRKVTGSNYDNIELTADVDPSEENIVAAAIKLNRMANDMIKEMDADTKEQIEQDRKLRSLLDKLEFLKKQVLKKEIDDLPF